MNSSRQGGCRCGAVRFKAAGAPKFVGNCHCNDCRKATGAAFSTYVGYRDDEVTWTGEERRLSESSPGVSRGYCAACGAPVSYQGHKWAGETHLFIGSFDEQRDLVPTSDVFAGEALPWVLLKAPRT